MLSLDFRITASVLIAALVGSTCIADQSGKDDTNENHSIEEVWLKQGWPLVQTFCIDCHNADNQEAELDLSSLGDPSTFEQNAGSMKRILEMVRFGAMPPEDADQLSDVERKTLVDALDKKLYASSCDLRPRPGKVSARRLNRAEYNHSIRDLFGIDLQPASDFPSDEVGAGFDNNGDILSLSPVLMEKYFDAAEKVAAEAISDPHDRVVVASDQKFGNKWQAVPESADESLRPLLRRAFRTEIGDDDVKPYVDLVVAATDRGDNYYQGLRIAVTAILVSPRFLFRIETAPKNWSTEEDNSAALTQHQLATRLSYFIWASIPDDELLDAAAAGDLKGATIEHHVRRMLQDPKADALATQFAAQWLGLRNLEQHEADNSLFAEFTPSLRRAMKQETELLFMHMVRNNRPITEMLTSDFTFANKELATFYGIEGVDQEQFVRVSLTDLPRRGVLSHASVLTLTSNPQRTSPVKRGKWILETVFGTPPPDPPPGVPVLEETKTADADASFREQLELHRASPTCASCHRVMDQLGFGLEQFSPIGGFRETERDKPVDASGKLPDGRSFNGAVQLAKILADTESEAFAGAVTERLMMFALGRELSPADRCTVDDIVKRTGGQNYQWIDLILEVVSSRQFQYYDLPAPDAK